MALTLVSVTFRGKHKAVFIHLPVDAKGKPYINPSEMDKLVMSLGCNERGHTFTIG